MSRKANPVAGGLLLVLLLLVTSMVGAASTDGALPAGGQSARATFVVTTTADSGPGSLRDAINNANTSPGFDMITFNIAPAGAHTITPLTPLPALLDPSGVLIDGFTQPGGATAGPVPPQSAVLLIEINGIAAGPTQCFWVLSSGNAIQGLVINDWEQDGIHIESGITELVVSNNMVYCNFIGTDLSGTADIGNGRSMASLWAGVHIGNEPEGTTFENFVQENLISGNYAEGVWVEGPKQPGDVYSNHILGNFIGTDITGTVDLGNDHEGVCLSEGTHDNMVLGNLISGNDYDGVGIQGYDNEPFPAPPIYTYANIVEDNRIGVDINHNPMPNTIAGVAIGEYGPSQWGFANLNRIGPNNRIAHNGGDGVAVWEHPLDAQNADNNEITQNAIYDNGGLGIDLYNNGVTMNDPSDPDIGPNQEVNFPVISSAILSAGLTTVTGTIDIDTPPDQARVEVFAAATDPTNHGEGATYLGSTIPTAAGTWTFTTTLLVAGDSVTATTTDANANTSEFCRVIGVSTQQVWDCFEFPPPGKEGMGNENEPNDNCADADNNIAICEAAYCGTIDGADPVDYWLIDLPADTCYCIHVRVFADDTPGQYAYGGGLDPDLTVYASDCSTVLFYNDNHGGTFPDAEGNDSQYDCLDAGNCHLPGSRLYLKITAPTQTEGPYLLVINCYPCECPEVETCEYYKAGYEDFCPNGMPDFDQKQPGWLDPTGANYAWCGPVALANCFWWFDSKYESSPIDPRPFYPGPGNPAPNDNYPLVVPYGPWDDHDTNNVVPFVNQLAPACNTNGGPYPGTSWPDFVNGAHQWLVMQGLDPEYNITDVFGPPYEEIRDSVLSSQDVLLLLGFYEVFGENECFRVGGHYVTVAGVCTTSTDICISDPFFDKNEGDPPPGSSHGGSIHNDASLVSGPHGTNDHDRYHMDPIPFFCSSSPATWMLTDYPNQWLADGIFTFDQQNALDPSAPPWQYAGTDLYVFVEAALIICPVRGCCIPPLRGNVDYDAADNINIVDMTFLVAYLFSSGPTPPCFEEADINGDGLINIVDMTQLVAYLFSGGAAPAPCP